MCKNHSQGQTVQPLPHCVVQQTGSKRTRPTVEDFMQTPPKKRTSDLQWRILHGAVASNTFISVLNPSVPNTCPFCCLRETIHHVFTECGRLRSFFSLLTLVFSYFDVVFTERSTTRVGFYWTRLQHGTAARNDGHVTLGDGVDNNEHTNNVNRTTHNHITSRTH